MLQISALLMIQCISYQSYQMQLNFIVHEEDSYLQHDKMTAVFDAVSPVYKDTVTMRYLDKQSA